MESEPKLFSAAGCEESRRAPVVSCSGIARKFLDAGPCPNRDSECGEREGGSHAPVPMPLETTRYRSRLLTDRDSARSHE